MTNSEDGKNYHVLTLKDIASWQISGIESSSEIKARVPSLQRGAVWKPQQIEMLWDSIFRGFPIGSIVISEKIEGQHNKKQVTKEVTKEVAEDKQEIHSVDGTTHHILDGQQRCNAIAWGFVDPSNMSLSDDVVLWLDLQPLQPVNRLKNSVRKYLFRVTTKAHPWGFSHNDDSGYLSSSAIREAMKKMGKIEKPSPRNAFPYDAGFPVPVSLLIKHFKENKLDCDTLFKELSIETSKKIPENDLDNINNGLKNLFNTRLVALQVPSGIEKDIDDIEQIFERLNGQGAPLNSEELAYSTIKAYWPEVEEIISSLNDNLRHCTETRLVSLGVRVALTTMNSDKRISAQQDSKQIRDIFKSKEESKKETIQKFFQGNLSKKETIQKFFEENLSSSLQWIDANLLYRKDRTYGLPKYLRSSIAWRSRDVFAWLMLLARKYGFKEITCEKKIKKIIGIALTIHWFGKDKIDAVNFLLENKLNEVTISAIKDVNARKTFIYTPITPCDMCQALHLNNLHLNDKTDEDKLSNWKNFWNGVVVYDDKNGKKYTEAEQKNRGIKYGYFMELVSQERELLIYAQRDYIENQFGDFDPSNKLMWEGFNRPWDYDHILPSNSIGGTGNKEQKYTKTCQAWQQSIGNLTAIDFSFNRSAQDKVNATEKYGNISTDEKGFNIFTNKISSFEITHADTNNFEKSRNFVLAAKERLITIYREWYETLEIGGCEEATTDCNYVISSNSIVSPE